jgi:hypothetical protein
MPSTKQLSQKARTINLLAGWSVFLLSFVVYLLTLEPSVSFWDCGEFIASSYKLQVGHPPGAPFFQLVQRVFSLLAPSPDKVAYMMNAFSALASAATIMFLYWTIVHLARRIQLAEKREWLNTVAGLIGSLAFAFTDSFWFSAVEAEVYAFSSLFTAIVFWAILKWENVADEPRANRWIVFIAYLVGLSIGVHLLNLLAIPAIALIWYFRKYKSTTQGIVLTLAVSFFLILFIMYGLVQGTPNVAQQFELLFVNTLHLPFNSGLLFFVLLLTILLGTLVIYSHKKQKAVLNLIALSMLMIYIGFGSYAMIIIRSNANPPMDENNPENAYMLMKYLNRSQYGSTPLFTGYYYNAPVTKVSDGKPLYYPDGERYVKVEGSPEYHYDTRFKTIFPRMYSTQANHRQGYKMWGEIKGKPVPLNGKTEYIPTFGENIRYFISYQLNHMYIRYFMWNFSGRQNDNQGHGDVLNGNWLTGIGPIDKARLGHKGDQPASLSNPETSNRYYMLPFLLGLAGLLFHYRKSKKDFYVILLLFIMTGIAIVGYLNQPPYQPRERDYAYVGSFYAYSIWIGLGVLALTAALQKILRSKAALGASAVSTLIPLLLITQNYNDHDRSGRYIVRDLGKNYLNSCAPNAILFTYGDNDTFPLWYAQDVEGTRPDVRICNVTLLNGDWYIDQMKLKVYESDPLPINIAREKYEHDQRNTIFVREDLQRPVELSTIVNIATSDNPRAMLQTQGGKRYNYVPTRQLKITVDKEQVLSSGTMLQEQEAEIADSIIIGLKGNYLSKSDLIILDMLANNEWKRPIYFDLSVIQTSNLKLEQYLRHEGFAYRLLPLKNETEKALIESDLLYERLMNQFSWGNIGDESIFIDENLRQTVQIVQMKNNFYQLAHSLASQGDSVKALQVIDRLYQLLPTGRYASTYYDLALANVSYGAGATQKADHLLEIISNEAFEKITFYLSLGSFYIDSYQREINREISIVQEAMKLAEQMKRPELIQKMEVQLREIQQLFNS